MERLAAEKSRRLSSTILQRMPQIERILLGGLFIWISVCLWTAYESGFYGYIDVTVLHRYIRHELPRGDLAAIAHLAPSLILLTPLFFVLNSGFVLIELHAVAWMASLVLLLDLERRIFRETSFTQKIRPWLRIAMILALTSNSFTQNVLLSGHYEVFFIPSALWFVRELLKESPSTKLPFLWLLTLGIREDSGVYLAFTVFSLPFLPNLRFTDRSTLIKRAAVYGGFSILASVLLIKVGLPLAHAQENFFTSMWASWGNSWEEIFMKALSSPVRVTERLIESAAWRLDRSVGFLSLLSLPSALMSRLPGILWFIADIPAKTQLYWYGSAFLLPGLFLAALAGLSWGLSKMQSFRPALLLLLVGGSIIAFGDTSDGVSGSLHFYPTQNHSVLRQGIHEALEACPALTSAATDFKSTVYFPNRLAVWPFNEFHKADGLFFTVHPVDPLIPLAQIEAFEKHLESAPDWKKIGTFEGMRVFVRSSFRCSER